MSSGIQTSAKAINITVAILGLSGLIAFCILAGAMWSVILLEFTLISGLSHKVMTLEESLEKSLEKSTTLDNAEKRKKLSRAVQQPSC